MWRKKESDGKYPHRKQGLCVPHNVVDKLYAAVQGGGNEKAMKKYAVKWWKWALNTPEFAGGRLYLWGYGSEL